MLLKLTEEQKGQEYLDKVKKAFPNIVLKFQKNNILTLENMLQLSNEKLISLGIKETKFNRFKRLLEGYMDIPEN